MFWIGPQVSLAHRRILAVSALAAMGDYLCFAHELTQQGRTSTNEYETAVGLAIGARTNQLLALINTGQTGALSLLAAVVSGPHRADMHAHLPELAASALASDAIDDNDVVSDAMTPEARLFMWRLRKATYALGSQEIEWVR